jgi:hypothetical protein
MPRSIRIITNTFPYVENAARIFKLHNLMQPREQLSQHESLDSIIYVISGPVRRIDVGLVVKQKKHSA